MLSRTLRKTIRVIKLSGLILFIIQIDIYMIIGQELIKGKRHGTFIILPIRFSKMRS